MEKQVGQPCQDCNTPLIQGPTGVYCKPCYIKWKKEGEEEVANSSANSKEPKNDVDWDKIAEGKVRHAFAVEAYKLGKDLDTSTIEIINGWVNFVMDKKEPF